MQLWTGLLVAFGDVRHSQVRVQIPASNWVYVYVKLLGAWVAVLERIHGPIPQHLCVTW